MTDEELITRLRDLGLNSPNIAADRIEQLGEELELAQGATNHWIISYLEVGNKLAKAVDVIKNLINIAPEGDEDEWHIALDNAIAMLAKLEKPE